MKVDKNNFIERSDLIHKNKYDYSKVEFKKLSDNITICCPVHGEFVQTANSHVNKGFGCKKCGRLKMKETKQHLYGEAVFKEKCATIHNNKYDYSKATYIKNTSKITIICPIHGEFVQEARVHISRCGCQECANEGNNYWSYSGWEAAGNVSNNFDGYKVYIVKIFDDVETFYKIGKTYLPIKVRFSKGQLPYNYETIATIDSCAEEVCRLESHLQFVSKADKYTPIKDFAGQGECFSSVELAIKELHESR